LKETVKKGNLVSSDMVAPTSECAAPGGGSHDWKPLAPANTTAGGFVISPRLRGCVYVMYYMPPNTVPIPLGTAWAVESKSRSLLLTAYHCLNLQNVDPATLQRYLYICKSIALNDDGSVTFGAPVLSVTGVNGDSISDIAILKAGGTVFAERITLCPLSDFPSADNEDVVKSYHVPCQSFPSDIPMLTSVPTDYQKVLMQSKHHYFISGEHMHGSSGGVVVDRNGQAVALICSGYVPGLQLPLLPNDLNALWERVSALSEGRGTYTRCVNLSAVPALYYFCEQN
jgi:hypothetical protein